MTRDIIEQASKDSQHHSNQTDGSTLIQHRSRFARAPTDVQTTTTSDRAFVRISIIFGCVIIVSLIAAWVGCAIAGCRRKRRTNTGDNESKSERQTGGFRSTHTPFSSSAEHSSDCDVEMLTQLDAIMASDTFEGREWSTYQKEQRMKARRNARGRERTSQGIILPTNVGQLKRKMRALSRSLLFSMTKSDLEQDPVSDFVASHDVCEFPRTTARDLESRIKWANPNNRSNTESEDGVLTTSCSEEKSTEQA